MRRSLIVFSSSPRPIIASLLKGGRVETVSTAVRAKPFLKWAGGKSQLLEQLDRRFPAALKRGSIERYVEPFVGSGAVFLHIAQFYPVREFWISDINPELIVAYQTVRDRVEETIERLRTLEAEYLARDREARQIYFYEVRSQFNQNRPDFDFDTPNPDWIDRTVQLIFLNRTCFNGLFRVNQKGEFNVPAGRYKNPTICNFENLQLVSRILQRSRVRYGDFTECLEFVNDRTFVYFDPPYKPISKTSNFNEYSQHKFDDREQFRLRDFFKTLDSLNAKLMLSNSDPTNEDSTDLFFENAYAGYRIDRVRANRHINSNASRRGEINEILVLNYRDFL